MLLRLLLLARRLLAGCLFPLLRRWSLLVAAGLCCLLM